MAQAADHQAYYKRQSFRQVELPERAASIERIETSADPVKMREQTLSTI